MQVSFKIDSGNAAIQTPEEVADLFRKYATRIEEGHYDVTDDSVAVLDANGQSVGRLEFGTPEPRTGFGE